MIYDRLLPILEAAASTKEAVDVHELNSAIDHGLCLGLLVWTSKRNQSPSKMSLIENISSL